MALLLPDWPVPVGYALELNRETKNHKYLKLNTMKTVFKTALLTLVFWVI